MFQLTKVWVDPGPGVESMEIRYVWCASGGQPAWDGTEEAEVMVPVPGTDPCVRTATLEIPRYVEGSDCYLLHYRFGPGGEHVDGYSPVFTEEIVAREVEYVDHAGDLTEVRVLWSVGGWTAQNWSQATLDGLPASIAAPGGPGEQDGVTDDAIYELVQTVPLPRRYVARMSGPRGHSVEYVYQLLRTGSPFPEDDFVRWDDNGGKRFYASFD
ncbi:MAG TPA: hypothetical protein VFE55_17390 [Acidimicrobiia bacterium]|nr:hypothetical protein [Acidimicrobiia bacterium]